MSWIEGNARGNAPLDRLLGVRPELLRRYKAFYGEIWEQGLLPARVLEICRQRIAAIHACEQERLVRDAQVALSNEELRTLVEGNSMPFSESERVALALAEKIPYQHHEISDIEVARAERAFGARGAVALLVALSFFDVTCRWKLVFSVDAESIDLTESPLHRGGLA